MMKAYTITKELKGFSFDEVKQAVIAGATQCHISGCELIGINPQDSDDPFVDAAKAATTWDELGWVARNLGLAGAEADEAEMRSYGTCMRYR